MLCVFVFFYVKSRSYFQFITTSCHIINPLSFSIVSWFSCGHDFFLHSKFMLVGGWYKMGLSHPTNLILAATTGNSFFLEMPWLIKRRRERWWDVQGDKYHVCTWPAAEKWIFPFMCLWENRRHGWLDETAEARYGNHHRLSQYNKLILRMRTVQPN